MKWLIHILVLFPCLVLSQDLHIKNTTFNVTGDLLVNVQKSMINRGTIQNAGRLRIAENWVNSGVYTDPGNGTLIFDGQDLQYINHGESPINNATFINGRKHISTNFYIQDHLTLRNTQLFVPPGAELHLNEGVVLEYSPGDRVVGALFRKGNDITFPVGTPDKFLPIRIVLPENQHLELGVKTNAGLLSPRLDNTISLVSDYYWQLITPEDYNGSMITLGFEKAEFLNSIEEAIVGESKGLNNVIKNAGGLQWSGSPHEGTVTTNSLSVGPFFTLAKKYTPGEHAPINVLNLVTPDNDGYNDYLLIENIDTYPDNKVSIFDRWGTKLYEVNGYDNNGIRFDGLANRSINKGMVEKGTYFYLITSGDEKLDMGFFELMR